MKAVGLSKGDNFKKKLCLEGGVGREQELGDYAGEVGIFVRVACEELDQPISDSCKGFTGDQDVGDVFLAKKMRAFREETSPCRVGRPEPIQPLCPISSREHPCLHDRLICFIRVR